jgi:hypothetical protein
VTHQAAGTTAPPPHLHAGELLLQQLDLQRCLLPLLPVPLVLRLLLVQLSPQRGSLHLGLSLRQQQKQRRQSQSAGLLLMRQVR